MSPELTAVRAVFASSALISLSLAGVLFQNRDKRGAVALIAISLSIGLWSFCLFVTTITGAQLTKLALRAMYIFVGATTAALFVFVLEYTGRERYITRETLVLLSVHPVLLVFFAFVNPGDLFFTGFDTTAIGGAEQQWGPAFWVHSAYAYSITFVAVLMLVELLVTARRSLYQGQAIALVLSILSPPVMNSLYLAGITNFDTTPLGSLAAAVFLTFAVVRYDLVNVSPIARDKLIDTVRDGMIVVDTDEQIVDSNPAAQHLFGAKSDLVGSSLETVFADMPALLEAYEELTADPTSEGRERTVTQGELSLQAEVTPIHDDRNRHVGWLLLLQDVSEQKQRERDLEQQIEKLDQFASLVSHDLRNPINVARGHLQIAKQTGDEESFETIDDSLQRMEDIIDDVLTLAREGQEETEPSPVSLDRVARSAWESVDTGSATLRVTDETEIMADDDRLQRLFENLYRNSIEHGLADNGESGPATDEALEISVSITETQPTDVTIAVADNGVGLPVTEANKLFEDGYTTDEDGTGLGLTIVEQIAHAHDWEVRAANGDGGGARFEIEEVSRPL